jgi:hypothetical protein
MSHCFYNIISFGGRALPVPVAELGRSAAEATRGFFVHLN